MKRITKSASALALAGALVLGTIPAQAQDAPVSAELSASVDPNAPASSAAPSAEPAAATPTATPVPAIEISAADIERCILSRPARLAIEAYIAKAPEERTQAEYDLAKTYFDAEVKANCPDLLEKKDNTGKILGLAGLAALIGLVGVTGANAAAPAPAAPAAPGATEKPAAGNEKSGNEKGIDPKTGKPVEGAQKGIDPKTGKPAAAAPAAEQGARGALAKTGSNTVAMTIAGMLLIAVSAAAVFAVRRKFNA